VGAANEATISGATAAQIRPALNIKRGLGVAQTKGALATAAQTKALTPIKKQQGRATVEKTRETTKAIPQNLKLKERGVAATERQAATAEGRLRLAKDQFEESKKRVAFTLKQKDISKADTDDRQEINDALKILGAFRRDVVGDVASYSEPERAKARERYEAAVKRRDARRKGRASSASSGSETILSFKGRPEQMPRGGKGTKTFAGKKYTWEKFLADGLKRGKDRADLKSYWAGL
jgi:hypothetical protein